MEAALAAGVLLCLVPESTLMLTRATMLSPEGRSKTLDASADGYVRGETCRALFLSPTANAAQQAQQALGLLLSSAVNTNGRASSLTAPNGPAQQALLRDALATAGVRGADVAGLQMHSNGTALGDPIEVGAASAVYLVSLSLASTHEAPTRSEPWQDGPGQPRWRFSPYAAAFHPPTLQEGAQRQRRPFLFATVKGFTGHQESGAGVAGLQAASVLVQAAAAPAALHLRHLNPHVFGALAGHAVSIARGGPFGVPVGQPGSSLLVGVSSFGAQGTNAHALMAGSGAAAVTNASAVGQTMTAWRRSRCYVAPAVQQLLSGCVLRGGKRGGRPSSVTFDGQLSAARLAYLWQYSMQGRPFLAGSALLSMAASMLPLLGGVAAGEDSTTAAALAAVTEAALVAPAQLPQATAAKVAPAAARAKLVLGSGAVEVALAEQRLLTAKLAGTTVNGIEAAAIAPSGARRAVRALMAGHAAAGSCRPAGSASTVAQLASLSSAEVSGYALHPVLLDASLGQVAGVAAAAAAPLTWLRSVAALSVGASSPAGGSVAAAYQPSEHWHVGSSSLVPASAAAPTALAFGVVLGDQDIPPASPGPASARLHAAPAEAVAAVAAEQEEEEAGIPADHPLLQMAEEERLMHLEAQVGAVLN